MKKIVFVTLLATLAGCYRDNEEMLYPESGPCDAINVSYRTTIAPILQQNGCTGCHSGTAPSGNISLDTYTGVRLAAQNGKLFGSINHNPGYSPMPKGGGKLTNCSITKVKAWIDAGSINN